jgi:hypothetical protein
MTTYDLFLCWIIVMLLVLVVGEANIIKSSHPHIDCLATPYRPSTFI